MPTKNRPEDDHSDGLAVTLAGEHLSLGGAGTCWYPAFSALIVADIHLGKAAAFRASGLPVPEGHGSRDLHLLGDLVTAAGARRLVIAGDLLHAPGGITAPVEADILDFRERLPGVEIILVPGNHDRTISRHAKAWGMDIAPNHDLGPFRIVHKPEDAPFGQPSIAGHLHPAMRWSRPGHGSLRCRCFWWRAAENQLVLPSFGSFTGSSSVRPAAGDKVFISTGSGSALPA